MAETAKDYRIPVWTVVSGEVLYDHEINDAAYRVYSAISGLCGMEGHCYASNAWFTEKLGKDKTTISRAISRLEKSGFIITTVINVPKKGSRRFIFTFNKKQLRKLSQVTEVNGSTETADILSGMASVLLEKLMRGVGKIDHPPIGEIEEGEIGKNAQEPHGKNDNHRIIEGENKEGEEKTPPHFKSGSNEDIAWKNYQRARVPYEEVYDPDFWVFFEKEVLGRFSKQEVYAATLNDWYSEIWGIYDLEDVIRFLKQQKDESPAWQVHWKTLKKRLIQNKAKKEQIHRQREVVKTKTPEERKAERLRLAETDLEKFLRQYQTNPFFQEQVDDDPELSEFIPKENKVEAKRKCSISSDGRITCTEKKKALV